MSASLNCIALPYFQLAGCFCAFDTIASTAARRRVVIENEIIVQKDLLAAMQIMENSSQLVSIIVHDRKLAGGVIIDRRGNGFVSDSLTV